MANDISKQLETLLNEKKQVDGYVIVVDDNSIDLIFTERLLSKEGYKVILCQNGAEMIDSIINNYVILVITDLILPNMDGLEIGTILNNHDIPCILTSDHDRQHEKVKEAKKLGITFIEKSKQKHQLCRKMSELLQD